MDCISYYICFENYVVILNFYQLKTIMKFHSMLKMQLLGISIAFLLFTFSACKKENSSAPQTQLTEENSDASIFKTLAGDTTKLILRPGPELGQDVYIQAYGFETDVNYSSVPELPIKSWTNGGAPIQNRSFIKFTKLSDIPANATILSAHLYLYGLSQSISTPGGNAGSNSCWVQRVTGSDWDESTLTWENGPASTTDDEASLPASTSTWNYNVKINVTAMVQKMVANPSTNFGFCILPKQTGTFNEVVFASAESTTPALRPRLIVFFK